MRVLLDEHLPLRFAAALADHEVSTVRDEGWSGSTNGVLLNLAADAGFDVLVTNDRSIEHQQNLAELRLGVVVLDAPSNKLEDLMPPAAPASTVISSVRIGEIRHVTG